MATLAHNLDVRRAACKSCYNCAVGWIGDAAHQSEQSDHNPDSRGIVHAIDVMVTGAAAQAVVNWALAHPADLEYVIHNRVIWTRGNGWKPKKYTGSDPHTNHVHISGQHGSTGKNSATGTGYNTTAEAMSPTGTPCNPTGASKPTPPKTTVVPHAPGTRVLELKNPVMTGADVSYVQTFIGPQHCGKADGEYGKNTVAGVKWYQGMRGITVDGEVGPVTWANMHVKYKG